MNTAKNKAEKVCTAAKKCSGCQLSNMNYERQLKWKQNTVYKLLRQFGTVKKIVGMSEPCHYRNKQQFVFRRAKNGKIVCGLYQSKTNGVVECFDCLINNERACEIAKTVTELLQSSKIKIYSPKNGSGNLKHMLIKTGNKSGEILLCFVCAKRTFKPDDVFIEHIIEQCPDITTITEIVNKTPEGVFLDGEESIIFGRGYITDSLCKMKFKISAKSFYQINPTQTERLYTCAIERARLEKGERVLDAYSGVGTIGIIAAAQTGAEVLSVELNPDAYSNARENAELNDVQNISFVNDDAQRYIEELAKNGEHLDCVIADPPRAGCSRGFLLSLIKIKPKRVVYVSCNPKTLQRDLYFLTKNGYKADFIRPFDMFPFTNHVETVCVMSCKED
ncbi:23S rRNA (uracil(1939)-C(5))-methyltransferase RlmD [Ruminococcus sp. zg-921]|uniref:23S rRNA (uracil(1939)-C(5))-methyltransferase RlmD n=1 Tax=Ruminococcus sp. zg-921 TaxID=2678506 RepID=UPI002109546E|nr:23S rRNA (uracil(1939)-C(5))-methyltransferase RlmD [Ruminococcus sp. zg-921]MCQ4113917.1 23S rRNA (uracil(1939)-C(5))-methyltransferase RlmD [Ruminococcus sp. zg-921]